MGIYVFSREVLLEILDKPGIDFGKEIIPKALGTHRVSPYIFRGYWADVGTIDAFYDANISLTRRGAPFNFFHPRWPIYTHPRFLPATRVFDSHLDASIVAEGCYIDRGTVSSSVIGIRTRISPGAKVTRSVLLGADFYEEDTEANAIPLGIGRDVLRRMVGELLHQRGLLLDLADELRKVGVVVVCGLAERPARCGQRLRGIT